MVERTSLAVTHASGTAEVLRIGPEWDQVARGIRSTHPSVPFGVVRALLSHSRGTGGEPHCWLARNGEDPVAALLCVRERLSWGAGAWQLRTPGDHDAYPLPLLAPLSSPASAATLIRGALKSVPGCARMRLVRQTNREYFRDIVDAAPDLYFSVRGSGFASYLAVPDTQDMLWSSLSANFRKNLRKQRKKLEAAGTISWHFLEGAECTPEHIEQFLLLEASGWKGERGGAILMRPAAAAYYRDALRELASGGQLELHLLAIDGRCVAGQLGVRRFDTLNLLKIAYDENAAHLAPGNMLFLELALREISAKRVQTIDCLTNMPWHRNWAMAQRELLEVQVFPRTLIGFAVGYLPRALHIYLRGKAAHWRLKWRDGLPGAPTVPSLSA